MRYFLAESDKKYGTIPVIKNWYERISMRKLEREGLGILPRRALYVLEEHSPIWYPDIVFHPFPMVSERVKAVIELYEPALQWKQSILLEQKRGRVEIYYVPLLEEKEYLSEKTVFSMDHSNIKSLVLKQEKIGDTAIFNLKGEKAGFIILRLDLVESLLRRKAKGFLLREADCMGGGNICQN